MFKNNSNKNSKSNDRIQIFKIRFPRLQSNKRNREYAIIMGRQSRSTAFKNIHKEHE